MITFVNHKGECISLDAIAKKHKPLQKQSTPLKKLDTRDGAKVSMGFEVIGFSPAHLVEAKRHHEKVLEGQQVRALIRGEKKLSSWNEAAYMRETKPKRVAPKPYVIASSADTCAELARKEGWKNVIVHEILKG